ncbi:serine/threonine-protein kinase PAK 3-like isoform X2 [Pseudopipra pipra]|uniref:serine/threonine-protein kinase PAK 3-like isoform X2 n=1 Tax=Pseudopipra pipra TaxID=415032 RepID=UPI0031390145
MKSDTTVATQPLLAPSDSGQENEEEEVEKEPVAVGEVMPEGMKSILKSSAMAGAAAVPQPKEISLPDIEMPSTSTGKRGTGKKCTQKTSTGKKSSGKTSTERKSSDQPQLISSLTSIYLADLKGIVSEGNPTKKYTLQQIIGQGTFGTVFRGVDIATGGQVAIKKIFLGDQKHQSEKVVNEVTVLKRMRHPNIIRYIDSYVFNEELWLVMEYVEGCTLAAVVSKQALEEEMIASISQECLKALDFLHSNRVIHRDIKSDNILLGMDGSVKLIGFGSCVWLLRAQRKQTSVHGTPFYMAPEMLRGDRYDAKVDIWALGITALEMVDGSPEAQNKLPELETPRELSPVFHSFLHSCLNRKVKCRWTARKLLKHPFLEKSGSLTNMSPLLEAARRSRAERFTTPSPEHLLAPSLTGEESKEEQVEKENVKAMPEGMKSILKSSAMAAVAAAPQAEEVTFANTEMPSTSTGKGDARKKSIPKEITHRPPTLSPLTRLLLAELKGIVSEGNPAKKYTLQQQIGQGAFGTVFRGVDIATGGQVAIKKIFLRDRKNKRELVVTEVSLLSSMRHPNIIRYIDSYVFNEELWLVMEYVEGCTLAAVVSIQALEEEMIASISRECLKGLDFLHSILVIHRDIKSDNILLGMDGSVKLIDFGFCAWLQPWQKKRRSFIGTPFYMAPEMLRGDRYDAKVDIWALGITALEMVDGSPEVRCKYCQRALPFSPEPYLSPTHISLN